MTPTDPAAVEAMIERVIEDLPATVDYYTLTSHGYLATARVMDEVPELVAMLRALAEERDALTAELEQAVGVIEDHNAEIESLNRGIKKQQVRADQQAEWSIREAEKAFAAEAEAAALREALTKMRGYAVHDDDCGLNALLMPRPPLTKQCTCGLSDLIKENHDG